MEDDMFMVASRKTPKPPRDLASQGRVLTPDERVDMESEKSMDASDPPSVTAPGDNGDPVPSSGYREEKTESPDKPD